MMNIRSSISILCIMLQSTLIYSSNFSSSNLINRDTLYSWADGGLNLRASNDINSSIIGSIPFGEAMVYIKRDGRTKYIQFYKASTKDTLVNGSLFKCINYLQEGHWAKVKYNNVVGFVFSAHISRYKPGKDKSILNCIQQNASLIHEYETYDTIGDRTTKYIYFKDGISVVGNMTNSSSWTYTFPDMSLEEAMLLARKLIESRMKYFSRDGNGCVNEKIGSKENGSVSYVIENNTNWGMQITWTNNSVTISEWNYC